MCVYRGWILQRFRGKTQYNQKKDAFALYAECEKNDLMTYRLPDLPRYPRGDGTENAATNDDDDRINAGGKKKDALSTAS
jgi:hypothetical protein